MRRPVISFFVALALFGLVVPSTALAGKRKKRQSEQQRLNKEGIVAVKEGNYEDAIELFNESLELGELNVTYLNLGRAYAKAGRCRDALKAYDKMAVAPRVEQPPAEVFYEKLTEYRDDLKTECEGALLISCKPASLGVVIDDGPEISCPSEPISLPAGEHVIRAMQSGKSVVERTVDIVGMETTGVDLIHQDAIESSGGGGPGLTRSGPGALDIVGWSLVGVGVSLLVSAVVIDNTVLADSIDAFSDAERDRDFVRAQELKGVIDTTQTLNLAFYAAGGGILAAGIGLAIWGLASSGESSSNFSFDMSPNGDAQVMLSTTF